MRRLFFALVLLVGAPAVQAQTGPDLTAAETTVRAYVDTFGQGDFRGAAELMDPVELDQFVDLVGSMMAMSGAPADAGEVPDDGPEAFAWFLETMGGMAPGMTDAMQTAEADILGSVAEGDSLVHVVMRTRASVMGIDAEQVSTTTTRLRDGRWVVALSGDLQTFAQAMRQMGGAEPTDDVPDDRRHDKDALKPGQDG